MKAYSIWVLFSVFVVSPGSVAQPLGYFTNIVNLGAGVNSISEDENSSVSPDGLLLYFESNRAGGLGNDDLYMASRSATDEPFGNVRHLTEVSSPSSDISPRISPDGLTLYFVSDRPGGKGFLDIWVARRSRTTNALGNPEPFGTAVNLQEVNTPSFEAGPFPTPDGLTLYFLTGTNNLNIWRASRARQTNELGEPVAFGNQVMLGGEVNTPLNETSPHPSSDELSLFFHRRDAAGSVDVWFATRSAVSNDFANVMKLGAPITTGFAERHPNISADWPADGSLLYFDSDRLGGEGETDLWQATWRQFVSIPDPELDLAVRDALRKPTGDISVEDMESLTTLDSSCDFYCDEIRSLDGLQFARNLTALDLAGGETYFGYATHPRIQLNDLSSLNSLSNLIHLNLSQNQLTDLALPAGLGSLMTLDLHNNGMTNLTLPPGASNLTSLNLHWNELADFSFLRPLSGLTSLNLRFNGLTSLSLPDEPGNLVSLDLAVNQLTQLILPTGLSNLTTLDLEANLLTDFGLPEDLRNLVDLNLERNSLTSLSLPTGLDNLAALHLGANSLTNLTLSSDLRSLTNLNIGGNQLTRLLFPTDLTNLTTLRLNDNHLADLTLPAELTRLRTLDLQGNQLSRLSLPPELCNLTSLDVRNNPLTEIALPAGIPNLHPTVLELRNSGVQVELFPVMKSPRRLASGEFAFEIVADLGFVEVLRSSDLRNWTSVETISMVSPSITFIDGTSSGSGGMFYRLVWLF